MLGDDDGLARGDGFDVADVYVEFDGGEAAHGNLHNIYYKTEAVLRRCQAP
jgi:hypothetical protein